MMPCFTRWLDEAAATIAFCRRRYYVVFTFGPLVGFSCAVLAGLLHDYDPAKYEINWPVVFELAAPLVIMMALMHEGLLRALENRANGIRLPPAYGLDRLLRFLFPQKAYERIFSQTVIDFRLEHAEMLSQHRPYRAEWLAICLIGTLLLTVAVWSSATVLKHVAAIWRLS